MAMEFCPHCHQPMEFHTDRECVEALIAAARPFVQMHRTMPNAARDDVDVLVQVTWQQWETLNWMVQHGNDGNCGHVVGDHNGRPGHRQPSAAARRRQIAADAELADDGEPADFYDSLPPETLPARPARPRPSDRPGERWLQLI